MLDAAGIYGVGKLIQMAHSIVEDDAAERGWRVGAELAPGQLSGWAIGEQKLVATLLDLGSIGVSITESGMLVPQKSASLMVGIGPEYESSEVRRLVSSATSGRRAATGTNSSNARRSSAWRRG